MKLGLIEKEALDLAAEDRAELAYRLLESLDGLPDPDAEALWLREAQRRAKEIDGGIVERVSVEELERRIQAQLK